MTSRVQIKVRPKPLRESFVESRKMAQVQRRRCWRRDKGSRTWKNQTNQTRSNHIKPFISVRHHWNHEDNFCGVLKGCAHLFWDSTSAPPNRPLLPWQQCIRFSRLWDKLEHTVETTTAMATNRMMMAMSCPQRIFVAFRPTAPCISISIRFPLELKLLADPRSALSSWGHANHLENGLRAYAFFPFADCWGDCPMDPRNQRNYWSLSHLPM